MGRILQISVVAFAMLLSFSAFAQVKKTKGSLKEMGKITEINVEFTYDNMSVGKFAKEQDYLDKKRGEYNEKEKGRGDRWVESWKADRKNRFEPKFLDLFSKRSGLDGGEKPGAKYTLIFNTNFTEPGYNVYVSRQNAYISGTAKIVETKDRNKVLAEFKVTRMPGRSFSGYDFDTGERIQEAYAKAGKEVGAVVKKEMKAK